jgi:hypothetical protein
VPGDWAEAAATNPVAMLAASMVFSENREKLEDTGKRSTRFIPGIPHHARKTVNSGVQHSVTRPLPQPLSRLLTCDTRRKIRSAPANSFQQLF